MNLWELFPVASGTGLGTFRIFISVLFFIGEFKNVENQFQNLDFKYNQKVKLEKGLFSRMDI